jgi:lipopolysaccharide/colanic/teichoic acid biosynthesis glycosyltransferase
MLVIAICIRLTSKGGAVLSQERVGIYGRLFPIFKFRSMTDSSGEKPKTGLTAADDHRVTPIGRFLRNLKIDELPQFFNILRGDMSLVGPRPALPQYTALFNTPYRPGLTGAATIVFQNEEELFRSIDPAEFDAFYAQRIKPLKAQLDTCYMCKATPSTDLRIIAITVLGCIRPAAIPSPVQAISTSGTQSLFALSGAVKQNSSAED